MTNIKHVNSVVDREFRNRINQLIDFVNAQGKSIQDLIAEGQLTPQQYAELITVINGLIKSGHVDKSDLTPEFKDEIEVFSSQLAQKLNQDDILSMDNMGQDIKEAMTGGSVAVVGRGAILTENIVNRQVTPEKTTFFTKTRNEFSGNYLKDMKLVGGSSYAAVEKESVNSRLAFLEVEPSTEYTMTFHDHENVLNIIAYAESTKHIDELVFSDTNNRASLVSQTISIARDFPTTFTTKSDTKYLYIYVSNESAEPRLQIEKGSESTEYIAPYLFPVELIDGLGDIDFGGQQKEQKLEDLMWTWHTFPISIYSERANKTFLGGVRRGTAKGTSGHNIYSIDEFTGEITRNQLSERFSGDDHNMVALADLPWKNQVMAFYAGHSGSGIYYKFINGYDVNNLSEERMIPNSSGSTYINIHHNQSNNTLYVISRVTSIGSWAIYYTDDFGETWNHRQLFDGNIYVDAGKRRRFDDKLGLAVTGHGGTGFPEIYYCYLTLEGTVHLPDGTQIADVKTGEGLPLKRTDLKLVAENAGSKTTVSSVNGGNHRLTFIHAPDEENFETFNYKFAIYNSDKDEFDEYLIEEGVKGNIMGTTHPHYVGSCYDVGFNNPHIYFSHYNDNTMQWEIWEYASRDILPTAGWNKTRMAKSDLKLFRPIGVMYDFNARKPIPGFWLKGYFTHYEEYYADAQIPFDMET